MKLLYTLNQRIYPFQRN